MLFAIFKRTAFNFFPWAITRRTRLKHPIIVYREFTARILLPRDYSFLRRFFESDFH